MGKRKKRHLTEETHYDAYEEGAPSSLVELLKMTKSLEDYETQLRNEIAHGSHSIRKREIGDPIVNKIHDFQKSLDALEAEIRDKTRASNETKCFIESFYDKVNCTKGLEQEVNGGVGGVKSRKKSKEHIDLLIRILKDKIGDLKSIKKHLRLNRLHISNNAESGYETVDEEHLDSKVNNITLLLLNGTQEADFNISSIGGLETSTVMITNEIKGWLKFSF